MDSSFTHGKTYAQKDQEKPPSPSQAPGVKLWDSAESDTESLAQERAYQQELHRRIGCLDQTNSVSSQEENADKLNQGDEEDEEVDDDGEEGLEVYDSLEVAAQPLVKRSSTPYPTEAQDTHQQMKEREGLRQVPSDDAYSDLRYDPNWRTNLKGACRFESPQLSVEEVPQNFDNKSDQRHPTGQGLAIKAGYRYIVARSPAIVETAHMTGDERPYHLHPHDEQGSQDVSLTSGRSSQSISTEKYNSSTLQRGSKVKHERSQEFIGENASGPPAPMEHFEEVHAVYKQEFPMVYEQEPGRTEGRATKRQQITKLKSPKISSNKKPEKLREDIVERNKITLGRNTAKCGSYLKAHALKQEAPNSVNEVCEAPEEATVAESLEDSSDPELRWLQKTQQLKVTQISKEKKARRKENPNPSRQQRPPVPGVKAQQGDCLSSPAAGQAAKTQPDSQKVAPSQPLSHTIHLNINLNTSNDVLPSVQQKGQDGVINLAPLHDTQHWSPRPDARYMLPFTQDSRVQLSSHDGRFQGVVAPQLALSPPIRDQGYRLLRPEKPLQGCREVLNSELHHWHPEYSPGRWQRPAAPKWLSPCEEEAWIRAPNEGQANQFPEDSPRPPSTTQSQPSGSYVVLPPIGKPLTEGEPEPSPGQSVTTSGPIQRSCSDGYLAQMDKQRKLREKVSYKAYTLKDYKQLKQDVKLRGLGPDYTANEKTKMRRQRLYSNVVREQNKKISRIPFLPAKDPEGNDKIVPRTKALEYAKTIAKPPAYPQPKPTAKRTQRSEGVTERTPYLEGLDLSHLATLELLRKRHEEEKQAVASFRKLHAL